MYLAVYFVAVVLGAHLDELAIDSLEDKEDVAHQRRLAHLPCGRPGRRIECTFQRLRYFFRINTCSAD